MVIAKKYTQQAALLTTLFGYLTFSFIFFKALLAPSENSTFIFDTAAVLLLVEIFNIAADEIIYNSKRFLVDKHFSKTSTFLVYIWLGFVLTIISKSYLVIIFFLFGIISRLYFNKTIPNLKYSRISGFIWIGTSIISLLLSKMLIEVFPLPQDVMSYYLLHKEDVIGIPQTALVWGTSYGLLMAFFEFINYIRLKKHFS